MATQVQFRGGTTTEHASFTGAAREVTVDTTKDTAVVHDGTTQGGFPLLRASGGAQDISTTGDISAADGTFTGDVDIADKIVHTGDTNTAIRFPSADTITTETGGSERLRIDSSGKVLFGNYFTSQQIGDYESSIQIQGTTTDTASMSIFRYTNDDGGANLTLGKGRGTSGGAVDKPNNGDALGAIRFVMANNNNLTDGESAKIECNVDAAPGGGDYPSRLSFYTTADSSSSLTERMRLNSGGQLLINTTSNGNDAEPALVVSGRANDATNSGMVRILRGENAASMSAYDNLGDLTFGSVDGARSVMVQAKAAGGWSGTSDCPGILVFATASDGGNAPLERMRINEIGEHAILGDGYVFNVASKAAAGTTYQLITGRYSATSTSNGTNSFLVHTNGDVVNTNDNYGQISDIKLKENIVDVGSQWDDFKAVRFRKFNFKEETGHETYTQLGVIAQELELTSPGLVYETIDKDENGNDLGTTTKAVKSSILTKKALVALQEAMAKIETLETKVAALEAA